MAGERDIQNRDLTLPPDTYVYLQNVGKGGLITIYKGPCVVNQTGQDQPVRFDFNTRTYVQTSLESAVQRCLRVNEGDYLVLENPSKNTPFPNATQEQATELYKGRKIVIPGPWCEALWPGQSAQVVEGHRLRSNQYLVAIIYNAEEAEKNWSTLVAKTNETNSEGQPQLKSKGLPRPKSFEVGTRIVVKGSDVNFFIPCTGVEVLKDDKNSYVREAVTLEQLEYCCLVDESGKKVYPKGPDVVFPEPTQVFETDKRGRRKFKPIELNSINGIHLKVTADFKGPDIEKNINDERQFHEGEELFVTGKTLSIYYPREELSIIEYGQGNKKHYSTAIPKGEGRYVINRTTGDIKLVRGPKMFLADPRTEIPVRRILSGDECSLMYPGNNEATLYNQNLAATMEKSPSGRSGMISEGDYRKSLMRSSNVSSSAYLEALSGSVDEFEPEDVSDEDNGNTITRGTKFTQPRTLTLNTKFDGVPRIEVWSGYAILVVGSEGSRRVVTGPEVVLLEYDEKLGFQELSTGKPKTSDRLYKTAYLKVQNNQVGDIVSFESSDHVKGTIKISLRVNFEGQSIDDQLKWFSVDNYVKFLTDHVRSIIAGTTKKLTVAEIKSNYVNIVRDAILGEKVADKEREGLFFDDNNMRVIEVEVLDISLSDKSISELLDRTQHKVVEANIELEQAKRELKLVQEKEEIARLTANARFETDKYKRALEIRTLEDKLLLLTENLAFSLKEIESTKSTTLAQQEVDQLVFNTDIERRKITATFNLEQKEKEALLRAQELEGQTDAAVKRFQAAKDGLYEVLVSLGRDEMASKLAEACTIERWLSGDNIGSSISNLVSLFPTMQQFFEKAEKVQKTNNRLTENAS